MSAGVLIPWHRWFAWYPVRLYSGERAWWVWVERQWSQALDYGSWDYRKAVGK